MINRVLIITNDAACAGLLKQALGVAKDGAFDVELVTQLATGLARVRAGGVDAVLLDMDLPDSQGIATFDQLFHVLPEKPIIIFHEPGDESIAIEAVYRGASGRLPKGRVGIAFITRALSDIIEQRDMKNPLFIQKIRAETILSSISDAVITTEMRGNVDYMNSAAEKLTGWSKEDALGRHISEVMPIINGTTGKPDRNPVELVLQRNEPMGLAAGTILVRRDGSEALIEDSAAPIHDVGGPLCGAVIVFHDLSASKAMTEKMAHLAQHDVLTDLPNRLLLEDRITQAIELSARRGTALAVLFLDIDHFKTINDTLGHDAGDQVLSAVAGRLSACVRSSDTVSRAGGDEFVILVLGDGKADDPAIIAEKILKTLAKPHVLAGQKLSVTSSIGISVFPGDGGDSATLIKKADTAMYRAKERGRNNYQLFSRDLADPPVAQHSAEADFS